MPEKLPQATSSPTPTGQTSLKELLVKLNKNHATLKEREAKYATAAPLDLLNQIDDYEYALKLTEQALEHNIPLDELQTEFSHLNLQIDAVVFVPQEPPRKPFTGQNPYRGLRKFTEEDADFFFGRTEAIQKLLDKVEYLIETETSQQNPDLIAVLGPSGSGKSSLVRAGLLPALRAGKVTNSQQWPITVMVPGPRPLDTLARQFVKLTNRGLPSLRADLDTGPQALQQLMSEALINHPDETVFVLGIDQFEETFTLCEDEAERQLFIDQLLYASQVSHNQRRQHQVAFASQARSKQPVSVDPNSWRLLDLTGFQVHFFGLKPLIIKATLAIMSLCKTCQV